MNVASLNILLFVFLGCSGRRFTSLLLQLCSYTADNSNALYEFELPLQQVTRKRQELSFLIQEAATYSTAGFFLKYLVVLSICMISWYITLLFL